VRLSAAPDEKPFVSQAGIEAASRLHCHAHARVRIRTPEELYVLRAGQPRHSVPHSENATFIGCDNRSIVIRTIADSDNGRIVGDLRALAMGYPIVCAR